MENFHNKENLHSIALTQSLVQNNMKSLPMEVKPSFKDQFSRFRKQCLDNVWPPATFLFLAQLVDELENNYRSTSFLYNLNERGKAGSREPPLFPFRTTTFDSSGQNYFFKWYI